MALSTYDVGDTVRLKATYTDTGGNFIDPTTVRLIYSDPSGNESTGTSGSELVHPSTGVYTWDVFIDEAGTWRWRSESTGNVVTAGQSEFVVRRQWVST